MTVSPTAVGPEAPPVEGARPGGRLALAGARPGLLVALILVLVLPAYLVALETRGPRHFMESIALLTSWETAQRAYDGEPQAWLLPTNNGKLRVKKPPLVVWMNLLAWTGLDPGTADAHVLIGRARLVTVAMGLVVVACTFGLGLMLGNVRVATVSALAVGLMPLLQSQARMASYDMHQATWVTVAITAAVWAIAPAWHDGPRRVAVSRRALGWATAALALAASCLSKNLLSMGLFAVPIGLLLVFNPRRRWSDFALLVVVTAAAAAPTLLWMDYAASQAEYVAGRLGEEYSGEHIYKRSLTYYPEVLLKMSVPWTLLAIAGCFLLPSRGRRGRAVVWCWFMVVLALYAAGPGQAARYILPLAPALALLIGWLVDHQAGLLQSGTRMRPPWLHWIHWVLLAGASMVMPLFFVLQDWLIERDLMDTIEVARIGKPAAAILGAGLLAVSALGFRATLRRRPLHSAWLTAVWAAALSTVYWFGFSHAPNFMTQLEPDAARLNQIVGDAPLRYLRSGDGTGTRDEVRFLLRRVIPSVKPKQLPELLEQHPGAYVIGRAKEKDDRILTEAGFTQVMDFNEDKGTPRRLWTGVTSGE